MKQNKRMEDLLAIQNQIKQLQTTIAKAERKMLKLREQAKVLVS